MVKNIVVIGGGIAGTAVITSLAPKLDRTKHKLILISERPFFNYTMAGLRVTVTAEGKLEDVIFPPLERYAKDGKIDKLVVGRAVQIANEQVVLENGETVPYNVLIVATGNTWRGPLNFPDTVSTNTAWVNSWRAKFKSAKSVCIIGGGAVGIELAGEIKDVYPQTKVTIVHNQPLVLNAAYPNSVRKRLGKQLIKAGVELVLDDTVINLPHDGEISGSLLTAHGRKIEADLFMPMYGGTPNTSIFAEVDPSTLSDDGHVRVLPTLQVPLSSGRRNVFACGDIIDWPEQHQALKAQDHAPVVVANVLSVLNKQSPSKVYKTAMEMIIVTIGRKRGLGYVPKLWGINLPPSVVSMMKGKGLFVDAVMKPVGLL